MMNKNYKNSKRSSKRELVWGFSLIEMIVYTAILGFVMVFVVFSSVYVGRSYKLLKSERAFAVSGSAAVDRLIREARGADTVDDSGSVYGTHPGEITLQPGNVRFFIEDGALKLQEGVEVIGALTTPDVTVTDFLAYKVITPHSEALRIELELESRVGDTVRNKRFFGGAVLKGSY